MYRSIDERLGSLQKDRRTIEDLIKEIQSWFHFWHLLEKESQQFLPMAEYLYDELHNLENPDFSPFIVQYCRVVENELWKKIFIAYHDHLQEKRINLDNIIEFDITPENESKALKFASSIKRDKREYTLGEIHWIISLLKISGNTYKNSLLLQNFRPFILQHFDEGLLQKPFLDKMEILKNDYRNKSAHPYPMNMDAATQFYDFIKNFLVELFENYKQQDYGVRHQ